MYVCMHASIYICTASVDVCLGSSVQTCKSAHFVCKCAAVSVRVCKIYRMQVFAPIHCAHIICPRFELPA